MTTERTRLLFVIGTPIILLLIPFIAMQFSDEVSWSSFDFLIAGLLLFGASFSIELIMRLIKTRKNRIILIAVLAAIFLIVWVELAVGIFGTPFAGS